MIGYVIAVVAGIVGGFAAHEPVANWWTRTVRGQTRVVQFRKPETVRKQKVAEIVREQQG